MLLFRMHLLFLDESGTPPKPERAAGRYFVIAGLIIPEGAWHHVAKEFVAIKRKYEVTGEVKWRFFGPDNKDADNSVAHLNEAQRGAFRRGIYSLIRARKSLKVIACVMSAEGAYSMPSVRCQDDVYHLTYKAVTERFQYFLQDVQREIGSPQFGMVISDHRMNLDDQKLRRHHHELVEGDGVYSSNYANIIETIQFAPSHFSPGLQLADMVAGAILRAFQARDPEFVEMFKSAFRTNPKDQSVIEGFGLAKMPKGRFREPSGGEG